MKKIAILLLIFTLCDSVQSQKVLQKANGLQSDSITTNVNIKSNSSKQEHADKPPKLIKTGGIKPAIKTKYNEVRQISSHNSYDRKGFNVFGVDDKHSIYDQAEAGCRSFEFDLHKGHTFPRIGNYPHSDWGIYHSTDYGSGGENCELLSECLSYLMSWHSNNPNHEIITIWLELDSWESGGHKPVDLDNNRLLHDLGNNIFTPQQLLSNCPNSTSLQDAIEKCGWPSLESLRNKFIVVLMGNNEEEDRYLNDVNYYRGDLSIGNNGYTGPKLCFVAPEIKDINSINNWQDAIFFNIHNTDGLDLALDIFHMKFVSRVYKLDNSSQWIDAWNAKAHHLATDHINRGVFIPRTVNNKGLPFNKIIEKESKNSF